MNAVLKPESILVVDDEPVNIKILSTILNKHYSVIEASNGHTALEYVSSETPPDMILLDVIMPSMSGFDVIRELKANPHTNNISVIFLTALTSEEDELKGLELGAVDYIFKPFNSLAILSKVKTHMTLITQIKFMDSLLQNRINRYVSDQTDIGHYQREIKNYLAEIEDDKDRLNLALWGSETEFWDWEVEKDIYHRSNVLKIFKSPDSSEKLHIESFKTEIHAHEVTAVVQKLDDLVAGNKPFFDTRYRIKNRHDEWLWVHALAKVSKKSETGKVVRISGTIRDITALKSAENQQRTMALSLKNISDGVWIANQDLVIQTINKGFSEITGYQLSDVIGKKVEFFSSEKVSKDLSEHIKSALSSVGKWQGELLGKGKSRDYFQEVHIDAAYDTEEDSTLYVGVFNDITYRKKTEDELRKLANYDTLTSLPNRTLFIERLRQRINDKRGLDTKFAILFIDLDNFKIINDSLGHNLGDQLLTDVARRLNSGKRSEDYIARLGGDEFTMLIEGLSDSHIAARICERILRALTTPFTLGGHEFIVTASIGISIYPDDGDSIADLMKDADQAMYQAKHNGKNQYTFYTKEMNEHVMQRLTLEGELRNAIKNNEINLHYQPKVNLSNGELNGMEALARWELKGKSIAPDVFIPIAEECGLIVSLGYQVLFKACQQHQYWLSEGFNIGKVAVNLSCEQFSVDNLVGEIKSILTETKLQAQYLELEITERTVMVDVETAICRMQELKNMGLSIAIDDFGTGYSSFNYLKRFPIDTLKIDRCFISDMLVSQKNTDIVASIINLAHVLGMQVVAEGVETKEQAIKIAELSAEDMQGFLYSRPLNPDDFTAFLNQKINLNSVLQSA